MSASGTTSKPPPGEEEVITCDALCSLSTSGQTHQPDDTTSTTSSSVAKKDGYTSPQFCTKQFQLPMFLSKTFHMIERCEAEIACWSEGGDSFVVKNVDKFASSVLPLYFKHSNFSSFARQLNFYGFRKLRPDTILTTDLDPATANHVRFYHQYFQRDKPELLQNIKRATTKGVEQSKDEVDLLRQEVATLRNDLATKTAESNQKIAELSYDCNRRISAMTTEFEKLAALVQNLSKNTTAASSQPIFATAGTPGQIVVLPTLSQGQNHSMQMHLTNAGNLFQSLSQAATATLQQEGGKKRPTEGEESNGVAKVARTE